LKRISKRLTTIAGKEFERIAESNRFSTLFLKLSD